MTVKTYFNITMTQEHKNGKTFNYIIDKDFSTLKQAEKFFNACKLGLCYNDQPNTIITIYIVVEYTNKGYTNTISEILETTASAEI